MSRDAALAHLDTYLAQVRRHLRSLPDAEAQEVLDELRSHVLDRAEGQLTPAGVEAALEALGSPRDVARVNLAERVAARMEADRSPWSVLRAVVRMATLSLVGFVTLMVSLFGYGFAAGFMLVAVWKVFEPASVGVWRTPDPNDPLNYVIGRTDPGPQAVEIMGWWIVPTGLILGLILAYLTWRFGVGSVRMMGGRGLRGR